MKIRKLYLDLTVWFLRVSSLLLQNGAGPYAPTLPQNFTGYMWPATTKGTQCCGCQCSILDQQVNRSMPPTNQDSPPYLILGEKGLLLKGLQVSLHEAV